MYQTADALTAMWRDEMARLLEVSGAVSLLVGADGALRAFTPRCARLMGLAQADIGQPIGRHPGMLSDDTLAADLARFFAAGTVAVKDVTLGHGEHFVRRIHAERTDTGAIRAVAIVYTSVAPLEHVFEQLAMREEILRTGEDRLRVAMDAAEIGSFVIDVAGERVFYSGGMAAMLGFPNVRETTLEAALARVHRDEQAYARARFAAALDPAGEGRLNMELRFVRPGGEIRWLTWNGHVEFRDSPEGRVARRVRGACAEITERKLVEQALRASEERFRALVGLASDWYWEQDANFRFVTFSDTTPELTGTSIESRLGKSRWELPTIGVSEAQWSAHRAMLERHEPFREFEFRRLDGSGQVIWVSVSGEPIFDEDGTFKGYRGTGQNITARKKAEAVLRESEARFRLLADSAPVLIWVSGAAGAEFFNRAYRSFLGVDRDDEIAGLSWSRYVHPDDRETYINAFLACERSRAQFDGHVRFRNAQGEYRWMKSVALPRFGSDGSYLGYVGSMLDITDMKRHEQSIELLVRELDHRVKNVLARVEVVIERTAMDATSIADFRAALDGRIGSMARAHTLLSRSRWQGVSLETVITDQLAPFGHRDTIAVDGPDVILNPDAAQAISMVVNELATNAAKYGSLSQQSGRVRVRWRIDRSAPGGDIDMLELEWCEEGGPPVRPPSREGYGTVVIRNLLVHELDATVDLTFAEPGVRCVVTLPLRRATAHH